MTGVGLLLAAGVGFLVSCYAYIIERKIRKDAHYKPMCDIAKGISCSKPIKSHYGRILGIPNSIVGIAYYVLVAVLVLIRIPLLTFYCTLAGALVSLYFAWILYVRIRTFCLICTITYLINFLLVLLSYQNLY